MTTDRPDAGASSSSRADRRAPSGVRKLAFIAVLLLVAFAVGEVAARVLQRAQVKATGKTNPYIDFVNPVPLFARKKVDGKAMYVRTEYQPFVPRDTQFTAVKADDTLRIFLLGSSAAAGWPHHEQNNGFTIAADLAQKLRKLYPGRTIEVLNVAGPTYGSHRVKFVFDEIIEYEPDLVLLYNGNNEFVETFVFKPRLLPEPWVHSALLRTIASGIERLAPGQRPAIDIKNYREEDTVSNRISLLFGQASRYRQDPEQFQYLLDRHRYNLTAMVEECKRRRVPVFLMNVPVNLKDWIPNVSAHRRDLGKEEEQRWQAKFRDGVLALERGEWEAAAGALAQSCSIDDEYAEGHYQLAVALQKLGRLPEAKAEYIKALERDAYPFRELPAFDRQLNEIARSQGVPLVDSVATLERIAGDGILGLDVLIDYVHLSGSSQEAIAHAVLEEMDRQGLLPAPLAQSVESTRFDVPKVYDDMATDRGLVSLYRQLLLMRQYDKIDPVHERLVKSLENQIATQPAKAEWARRYLQLANYIQSTLVPYRKLLRAEKLGILHQEFSEDEARAIFDSYVQMVKNVEGTNVTWDDFEQAVPEFEFPRATGTATP